MSRTPYGTWLPHTLGQYRTPHSEGTTVGYASTAQCHRVPGIRERHGPQGRAVLDLGKLRKWSEITGESCRVEDLNFRVLSEHAQNMPLSAHSICTRIELAQLSKNFSSASKKFTPR
eukprot:1345281-Rhodomonas_salina.3